MNNHDWACVTLGKFLGGFGIGTGGVLFGVDVFTRHVF
jgi:hypothetical protein